METVTFTNIRSLLPKMNRLANSNGERFELTRHKKTEMVALGWEDFQNVLKGRNLDITNFTTKKVTFTEVRSQMKELNNKAAEDNVVFVLERHKKALLALMNYSAFTDLVRELSRLSEPIPTNVEETKGEGFHPGPVE